MILALAHFAVCTRQAFPEASSTPPVFLQSDVEANDYGIGKQKTKQAFPFVMFKPTQGSGFSRSVQQQRKKSVFRT